MKTPEQLKGAIRNIAKEKDLHAQEVLQILTPLPLARIMREMLSQNRGGTGLW